ncbi:hypothetical protein HDU67_005247, partial [Dinochytrium kinnereticum]
MTSPNAAETPPLFLVTTYDSGNALHLPLNSQELQVASDGMEYLDDDDEEEDLMESSASDEENGNGSEDGIRENESDDDNDMNGADDDDSASSTSSLDDSEEDEDQNNNAAGFIHRREGSYTHVERASGKRSISGSFQRPSSASSKNHGATRLNQRKFRRQDTVPLKDESNDDLAAPGTSTSESAEDSEFLYDSMEELARTPSHINFMGSLKGSPGRQMSTPIQAETMIRPFDARIVPNMSDYTSGEEDKQQYSVTSGDEFVTRGNLSTEEKYDSQQNRGVYYSSGMSFSGSDQDETRMILDDSGYDHQPYGPPVIGITPVQSHSGQMEDGVVPNMDPKGLIVKGVSIASSDRSGSPRGSLGAAAIST